MASQGESSRGQSGGQSTSSCGSRSTPSIHQSPVRSASVSNTSPELGISPCIRMNIQETTTVSPSAPPVEQLPSAPPVTQPPPAPHAETSIHASEGESQAMEDPSNESVSTGRWDPLEFFFEALVDKHSQEEESSINQNELWHVGGCNSVLGKGNIKSSQSGTQLHDRLSRQLLDRLAKLEAEIAEMRAEMRAEQARREAFQASLFAALRSKGIDLSDMPIAASTPPVAQAPMRESHSHADEHSPMPKRPRTASAAVDLAEDPDDEDLH